LITFDSITSACEHYSPASSPAPVVKGTATPKAYLIDAVSRDEPQSKMNQHQNRLYMMRFSDYYGHRP